MYKELGAWTQPRKFFRVGSLPFGQTVGTSNLWQDRAGRWAALLVTAACAWWWWKRFWLAQLPDSGPSDFQFYYHAAQHVLGGRSPFSDGGYIYPPLLAFMLTPLAKFDYLTARWIWFAASHCMLLTAAYLLWRHVGRGWLAMTVIAFVWAAGGAAEDGLAIGQLDAMLVLLLVLAMTAKDRIAVAAIAVSAGLKLFPALLIGVPAFNRKWRVMAAAAAGSALLVAAPWAAVRWTLRGPAAPPQVDYLAGTPSLLSWSLPSAALRALEWPKPGEGLPSDWILGYDLPRLRHTTKQRIVSLSIAAATVLAGLLAMYRASGEQLGISSRAFTGAALMSLALAASPVCWWHYEVLQYPGAAIVLLLGLRQARPWFFCGALINCAFLFRIPAAVCRYYYHRHEAWPNLPITVCFWTAAPAVASLILFVLLTRTLRWNQGINVPRVASNE